MAAHLLEVVSRRDLAALDTTLNIDARLWKALRQACAVLVPDLGRTSLWTVRSCNLPVCCRLKQYLPTVSSGNCGIICFLYHPIHKLQVSYCPCNLDYISLGVCSLKQNTCGLLFCKTGFPGSVPHPKHTAWWRRYIIYITQPHLGEESILSHACKAVGFV